MADLCDSEEWCWLDQDFLKRDPVIQSYYKPPKPTTRTKWLTTTDIDLVLKQYEKIYPDFLFLGAVPIDFDEVIDEYKNLDLCSMYRGGGRNKPAQQITRYGFVFNTDPSDRKGSHWVCMFLSLPPTGRRGTAGSSQPFIGFFDSYGHLPPQQIKQLVNRLKRQVKNCLGLDLVYKCNTVQHQRKDTECGVYCLYFIYQCLLGHSFESITEKIILDDEVNQFRDFFFRPTINYQGGGR